MHRIVNITSFDTIDNAADEYIVNLDEKSISYEKDKLENLLSTLSKRYPSVKLTLEGYLDEQQANDIKAFVTESESAITVEIILPQNFINTDAQRKIDEAVSTNRKVQRTDERRKERMKLQPKQADNLAAPSSAAAKQKSPRTRPRPSNLSFDRDIATETEQEQEQEQHTETSVEVSTQTSVAVESSEAKYKISDALSESDFKEYFQEHKFNIPDSCYLMSATQASQLWQTWLGNIRDEKQPQFDNAKIKHITLNACEQLLRYSHQFHSGIDSNLRHLPLAAGFTMVDDVLDYNPSLIPPGSEKLPLIHNYLPESPAILAPDLFTTWLTLAKNPDKSTDTDRFLKSQWDKMNHSSYPRDAANLFKQYLPLMLTLPVKRLKEIFTVCEEKNVLKAERLQMLLGEMPKLAKLSKADIKAQPINKILSELFAEKVNQVHQLAIDCMTLRDKQAEKEQDPHQHLLYRIIQRKDQMHRRKFQKSSAEPTDKKQHGQMVAIYGQTLSFLKSITSQRVLDALLQVYNEYGVHELNGLFKQLKTWHQKNAQRFKDLVATLLSKMPSYVPLLQADYQQAISGILNSLTPMEYKVWQSLFKKHCKVVGVDNLPELFKAFTKFCDAIQKLGLKLDSWPASAFKEPVTAFKDIQSLPAALNRMLDILYRVHPDDRQAVWQQMCHLPLNGDGAIRALDDDEYPSEFVLPAMRLEPNGCDLSGARYGCKLEDNLHQMTESRDLDTLECKFYRYIAHFSYERQQRYSLNFYTQAVAMIKATSPAGNSLDFDVQTHLYALLAGSTINHATAMKEEDALAQWEKLCDGVKDISLPAIANINKSFFQRRILSEFSRKEWPFPIVNLLISTTLTARAQFSWTNPGAMDGLMARVTAVTDKMDPIKPEDIAFICKGIVAAAEMKPDFGFADFENYFSTVAAIKDCFGGYYFKDNKQHGRIMLQLVTQFQLRPNDVKQIHTLVDERKADQLYAALAKLTWMTPSLCKEKLQAQDLMTFIQRFEVDKELLQKRSEYEKRLEKDLYGGWEQKNTNKHEKVKNERKKKWDEDANDDSSNNRNSTNIKKTEEGKQVEPGRLDALKLLAGITPNSLKELERKYKFEDKKNNTNNTKTSVSSSHQSFQHSSYQGNDVKDVAANIRLFAQFKSYYEEVAWDRVIGRKSFSFSPQVVEKIGTTFPIKEQQDKVVQFLEKFTTADDITQHTGTIERLAYIDGILGNAKKTTAFLDMLLTREFYSQKSQPSLQEFNELLRALPVADNFSTFNYIMARHAKQPSAALMPCLQLFLNDKDFAEFNKSKQKQGITKKDFLPLSVKLLMRTPAQELDQQHQQSYVENYKKICDSISEMAKSSPSLKSSLFRMVARRSKEYKIADEKNDNKYMKDYVGKFVDLIATFYETISEKPENTSDSKKSENASENAAEILRSLMLAYEKPNDFYTLLTAVNGFNSNDKKIKLLEIIAKLANNTLVENSAPSIADIQAVCAACADDAFYNKFINCYDTAPYPPFSKVREWQQSSEQKYAQKLAEYYADFAKNPYLRDDKKNGFNLRLAFKQADEFKFSNDDKASLTQLKAALPELNEEIKRAKNLTPAQLNAEIKKITNSAAVTPDDYPKLVAYLAELLYRSTSQELNTTQYLAIVAMLQSNGHVTGEIATGQGKSRITMMLAACQYSLRKTVDIVTNRMYLAQRDYLSYKSFFNLVGAETTLLHANSPTEQYRLKGINFSDATNLQLFRNLARSSGKEDKVIKKDPRKRALLLDEADQTFFDLSQTRFNRAQHAVHLQGLTWVYPLLMQFLAQDDEHHAVNISNLFYDDTDACIEKFRLFVELRINKEQLTSFKQCSDNQVETWLQSAIDVRTSLRYQTNYTINPDIDISTPQGLDKFSSIEVLQNNNAVAGPKLLNGMQQCLLAELNRKRELALANKQNPAGSEALYEQLRQCKREFYIPPESQVTYSSTNKSLLDDYDEGDLHAVTGSKGSKIECSEAAKLYGKRVGGGAKQAMQFISVPDHEKSKRIVHPITIAKDEKDKIKILAEQIIAAHKENPKQGLVILCENDNVSQQMMSAVKELLRKREDTVEDQYYNYIPNRTSYKKEESLIEKAGLEGKITFTTDKEGRGANFNLPNGKLILTYPPTSKRAEIQIHGRIGRYGRFGEVQPIYTNAQLTALRAKGFQDSKNDSGFGTWLKLLAQRNINLEAHIERQQVLAERHEQCKRLLRNTIGDYQQKHTEAFYKIYDLCPDAENKDSKINESKIENTEKKQPTKKEKLLQHWCNYSAEAEREWNAITWPRLNAIIEQSANPDVKQIENELVEYHSKVQPLWTKLKKNIGEEGIPQNPDHNPSTLNNIAFPLPQGVCNLELSAESKQLMQGFDLEQSCSLPTQVNVYRDYNPALAGRSAVYNTLGADLFGKPLLANTIAALQGRGMMFADTIATLKGERELFANTRATARRVWKEWKEEKPSSGIVPN